LKEKSDQDAKEETKKRIDRKRDLLVRARFEIQRQLKITHVPSRSSCPCPVPLSVRFPFLTDILLCPSAVDI
jgi:hypothetical protein